ncbi:DUF2867 domain-containing protein [Cellulomonas wangsupingiae]|uniref:DUF2867 domain-containing protein n=1 Tax=Cellulomonas wangsupingiae TaxID=2968085 RepID=A0ABY5K5Q4_9CELL|nr:DUF2867 domain-containing protein [Cellulomonas wangsupingiae]MCC2336530.1 DUF2867 domain-containing protein [Cellulomonas wangsupingiae]MCC2336563.1 DUF2867 domain-containing protein [Cellulomonas wangsupingiae]UUI65772.1 DUF2867 domain-containing protein [Cellulomonas wangsupingiae]
MTDPPPVTASATTSADAAPTFVSLALRDLPRPDYCDVLVTPLPPGAATAPAVWARAVFDVRHGPRWVLALLLLRQVAVRLLGLAPAPRDTFAVREVQGEEALLAFDDRHLDFRVGVGVDADRGLLRVVTAVRLHGVRGRVYFGPVRLAHPVVTRAMVRSALRRSAAP